MLRCESVGTTLNGSRPTQYQGDTVPDEIVDRKRIVRAPFAGVLMVTYNHEKYIGNAIESVARQQTDFPFGLIIGTVDVQIVIGIGATVFDHICIGQGSIIGGGSVVTKDIPADGVAYGNPCRVVRDAS
jgi:hypothetical protein